MLRPEFQLGDVRALFLARQHLTRPRAVRLTAPRLVRFAEDAGGIQLDSINVVDRAHYLAVWARFGPYDRAALDRLVYERRLLFEYWAHAACLVPTGTLRWWRRAMADYRLRHTGWANWLKRNTKIVARVREAVAANGPMSHGDLESRRLGRQGGWWSWKPAQHAFHYLWMTGTLTVHSRKHFNKRYDLLARTLPDVAETDVATGDAFAHWHVERSLHAMGAATEQDLRGYLTFPRWAPGVRRKALAAMLDRGDVTEIDVAGVPGRWLALTRDLPRLGRAARTVARGTTLLPPFDSLLWYRDRVSRLFGYDYRIEVYTPGDKRVHGYYTLPILHDGWLIGRVDAKTNRQASTLEIRHVHFEPWFAAGRPAPTNGPVVSVDGAMAGLADAFRSLAQFVNTPAIAISRVSPARLTSRLRRAVRAGASVGDARAVGDEQPAQQ